MFLLASTPCRSFVSFVFLCFAIKFIVAKKRKKDWVSETMLIMNWILNSMGDSIAASFKYSNLAKGLRDSIEVAYAQKRNNVRIFELKREIAEFKHGDLSI